MLVPSMRLNLFQNYCAHALWDFGNALWKSGFKLLTIDPRNMIKITSYIVFFETLARWLTKWRLLKISINPGLFASDSIILSKALSFQFKSADILMILSFCELIYPKNGTIFMVPMVKSLFAVAIIKVCLRVATKSSIFLISLLSAEWRLSNKIILSLTPNCRKETTNLGKRYVLKKVFSYQNLI